MNGIRILCDTNTLIQLLGNNENVVDFLMGKQICHYSCHCPVFGYPISNF
jgi:hypothetical protein